MSARSTSRTAVTTSLKLARLPVDAAIRLLPSGRANTARLAVDRADERGEAAQRRRTSEARQEAERKRTRAATAEQKRKAGSRQVEARVESQIEAEAPQKRLDALQERAEAQQQREEALATADEAQRLGDTAAAVKAERKED